MKTDLAQALDKLDATRAALRAHLLAHEDPEAVDGATPETTTAHGVRMVGRAVEEMWRASTLGRVFDIARPIAVQVIRENPFAALAVALGLGAVMGFSPGARRGAAHTAGNLVWKSVDAVTLLTLLWQVYGQPGKGTPAAAEPAHKDPG